LHATLENVEKRVTTAHNRATMEVVRSMMSIRDQKLERIETVYLRNSLGINTNVYSMHALTRSSFTPLVLHSLKSLVILIA
jgi:hypothetical protein